MTLLLPRHIVSATYQDRNLTCDIFLNKKKLQVNTHIN